MKRKRKDTSFYTSIGKGGGGRRRYITYIRCVCHGACFLGKTVSREVEEVSEERRERKGAEREREKERERVSFRRGGRREKGLKD